MATDTDAPFTLSSLIGEAGAGSNGELLVNSLLHHYPAELRAATLKRENERLLAGIDRDELCRQAAKIAGADEVEATIRGGERSDADAVVTYVYYDERGDTVKGFFPFTDLGKASSRGHVSQRESLAGSPAARDHASAQAKARAAAAEQPDSADVDALREQVDELSRRLDDPEPVPSYKAANAKDIATMLSAADRATVVRVLEFEKHHEDRSTVTAAAEKRIEALDAEDVDAEKAAAAREAENEELRKRVAELEGQLAAGDAKPAKPGDGA